MTILSYALFRAPAPIYWRNDLTEDRISLYMRFLPVLVRAHHAIWPGYELRIYHDDAACRHPYFSALARMHDRGLLRLMPSGPVVALTLSMLWRMRPLFDENDHIVVTCDLDALPLLRLRRMVDEFAASDKAVMLVHGCEAHNSVLGGGLGARGGRFRDLVGVGTWAELVKLATRDNWAAYAADEEFLRETIWPRVAEEAIVFRHDAAPPIIRCVDVRRGPSLPPPPDLLPEVQERGDCFAPYIGSSGYEVASAFVFYDGQPLPAMKSIRECERALDLHGVMQPWA